MSTLRSLIEGQEGLELRPYRDSRGFLTIGYGRCLETRGITEKEADLLLENDIANAETGANTLQWFEDLDTVRQDVVVVMIFNLGLEGFLDFKNTISALKAHDWERAANAMLASAWAIQVGHRADTLSIMLRTGKYPAT